VSKFLCSTCVRQKKKITATNPLNRNIKRVNVVVSPNFKYPIDISCIQRKCTSKNEKEKELLTCLMTIKTQKLEYLGHITGGKIEGKRSVGRDGCKLRYWFGRTIQMNYSVHR